MVALGMGLGQDLQRAAAARLALSDPCQHPRDADHAPLPPSPRPARTAYRRPWRVHRRFSCGLGRYRVMASLCPSGRISPAPQRASMGVLLASISRHYTHFSTDVLLGMGRRSRWRPIRRCW